MLALKAALSDDEVAAVRADLDRARFIDAREKGVGDGLRHEKSRMEADQADPVTMDLSKRVRAILTANSTFAQYARPLRWTRLRFGRYSVGDGFGAHVDAPMMTTTEGPMRSDLSFTLFLADPETYDGGALVMDGADGMREIKLGSGDIVVYPTTVPHRVTPVTRGERWVCVGWMQSAIRQPAQREMLFDLSLVRAALPAGDVRLLLDKSISNLTRYWAEA